MASLKDYGGIDRQTIDQEKQRMEEDRAPSMFLGLEDGEGLDDHGADGVVGDLFAHAHDADAVAPQGVAEEVEVVAVAAQAVDSEDDDVGDLGGRLRLGAAELGERGFKIVIFPGGTARAVAHTLQDYYASLQVMAAPRPGASACSTGPPPPSMPWVP